MSSNASMAWHGDLLLPSCRDEFVDDNYGSEPLRRRVTVVEVQANCSQKHWKTKDARCCKL